MELWKIVIAAVGGPTILIGAVAYLAKSLIGQWLSKELKKFDSELTFKLKAYEIDSQYANQIKSENLKSELQLKSYDYQLRFSNLYEKRAAAISESNRLLVDAIIKIDSALAPLQLAGDTPVSEKYSDASESLRQFMIHFEHNRLYVPEDVCDKVDELSKTIREVLLKFGAWINIPDGSLTAQNQQAKIEQHMKAWGALKHEIPSARRALEAAFRNLLDPNHSAGGPSTI
ncbi:hypothetical protein [Burkholderia sp. 572]|uniref:hypothetical protein n=1 Tax=Burkholderia sp. 572 TaxID=3156414 RepID=UPI0033970A54